MDSVKRVTVQGVGISSRAVLVVVVVLLSSSGVSAALVQLAMETDGIHIGKANLVGDINDGVDWSMPSKELIPNQGQRYIMSRVYRFPEVGTNWRVWGSLYERKYYDAVDEFLGITFDLNLFAQHKVAGIYPTPHVNEDAPNLAEMRTYFHNLDGLDLSAKNINVSYTYDLFDSVKHYPSEKHEDTMTLGIKDFQPWQLGVLYRSGWDYYIESTITLNHPFPEPSTLLLLGFGVPILSGLRRK